MSVRKWVAVAVAAVCGGATLPVRAEPGLLDPVYVFYPRGSCREGAIELEVWDREENTWQDHPRHPQVPTDSCQLEDAGVLLHEIRWRCVEETPAELPPAWVVGLDVFSVEVMERCAVDAPVSPGNLEIHIWSPRPGATVRRQLPRAPIEGSVRIGGAEGVRYDVVIALDVSQGMGPQRGGPDLFAAQVDAAASLVSLLRHRLGSVRIGLVSFPNLGGSRSDPGETGARRDIALTRDANELDRAIRRIRARGSGGFQSFSSGLDFAVRELLGENPGSGARTDATKVLVLTADGRTEMPFGPRAADSPGFVERSLAASEKALAQGVKVQLFALAGVAGDASDFVRQLIGEEGSFRRIPQPRLGTAFLRLVSLPYVREVRVTDLRSGEVSADVRLEADGSFSATVPVERGPNPVLVTVVTSEGLRGQREIVVNFDDSLVQEALREAERERILELLESPERKGRVEIKPETSGGNQGR